MTAPTRIAPSATRAARMARIRPAMLDVAADDRARHAERAGFRVALVRGPIVASRRSINNEAVPAIGLAYLAGYLLKKGFGVEIVDSIGEGLNRFWPLEQFPSYHCQGLSIGEIVERIPADARVIGFSVMFSGEWPAQRMLISAVRERFPDAFLLAGGEHMTALGEYSLRDCPALDLGIRGEGEHTLFEVVEALRLGEDPRRVTGVSYRDGAGAYVEVSGLPRIRDVGQVPWPHWPDGYLEKFWAAGKSYGVQTARDMPMTISRGCPFQCTFCSSPTMWTTRYALRDIEDVIAEVKHCIARYDITAVQLYDLTAITKRTWVIDFCRRLREEGIALQWSLPSGTRSEALDDETLGLLYQVGCRYMVYAPESGSVDTLRRIKKQVSLERLTRSVLSARRLGFALRTNLIIGFPFETRRDVFRTVRFGLMLAIRGVDEVSINIYSPYPGTELFDELRAAGGMALDDAYFLSLQSLNSDYTHRRPITFNAHMGAREIAFYRLFFMATNYLLSYLLFPSRIVRTIRNLVSTTQAATVLEHRLKDMLVRRGLGKANAGP